ncbi:MAG TPA: hypothetical protein VIH18_20300 [Candidatus Binatia bacterium]|jgi:hypothetical protein
MLYGCLLNGAAVLLLVACAKSPESISPSYISDVGYQSWSCEQLGQEQMRLSHALASASTQQRKARTNDTVGVIFLGLPVSSLSGDNIAPEIARLKGENEAIIRAMRIKGCSTVQATAVPGPESPVKKQVKTTTR